MFEKVCHLLPQQAGTVGQVVAGKEANEHRLVSRGHRSPAVSCKKADSRRLKAIHRREKEGCACEQKHGKTPTQ